MDTNHEDADVLIVGGGSAGAVLASRLSEDPGRSVVLIEAGVAYPPGAYPQTLQDPARVGDPGHDWGYSARSNEAVPPTPAPRGKVLGGSSAVNAGVALRARPIDFRNWTAHGLKGWSWHDVLPDYRTLENTPAGEDALHGRTGPLAIRQRTDDELTPSSRGFIEAAVASGYKHVDDYNGADQDGTGGYPVNILGGVRQNTGMSYLTAPVRERQNLTIIDSVTIDRVVFQGTAASGVVGADGTVYRAREVILSAGTYGSPAILMRSGVGPAEDLRALGIEVLADLPVGQRLQDQPFFYNAYALASGALQMAPATGALLWTATSEAAEGELDLHLSITHLLDGSYSPTGGAIVIGVGITRPESTGTLTLASRDPEHPPVINNNFLATDRDRRRMLEGLLLSRSLARHPAAAPMLAGEMLPGEAFGDDASLKEFIQSNTTSYAHPTATVPMGGEGDPWAVVDSNGLVKGISALRVVDASIIPEVPSSTTNVTTIMMAEHISRVVYGV